MIHAKLVVKKDKFLDKILGLCNYVETIPTHFLSFHLKIDDVLLTEYGQMYVIQILGFDNTIKEYTMPITTYKVVRDMITLKEV